MSGKDARSSCSVPGIQLVFCIVILNSETAAVLLQRHISVFDPAGLAQRDREQRSQDRGQDK